MKYASIIVIHYAKYDDFGGKRAISRKSTITRSETIRYTINSIQKNTKYPYELIVIDNGGGGDDSDWLLQKSKDGVINTYIRNKDNLHYGFGRNQGLALATGDYIVICDNDMEVHEGWLTTCIDLMEKLPYKKLIASPICTPDKNNSHYWIKQNDEYRINSMAGSSCFIVPKDVMREIGMFKHAVTGGTFWHRRMKDLGYNVILPTVNMADHLGFGGGLDIYQPIESIKVLSTGEKIDFSDNYGFKTIFNSIE